MSALWWWTTFEHQIGLDVEVTASLIATGVMADRRAVALAAQASRSCVVSAQPSKVATTAVAPRRAVALAAERSKTLTGAATAAKVCTITSKGP